MRSTFYVFFTFTKFICNSFFFILTFVRNFKRIITHFEFDFEFANKRIRLSSNQLSIFFYSIQDEHFEQFNHFCDISNWRKRFKSSFFKFFDNHYSFIIKQFTINSQLKIWFDAIFFSRRLMFNHFFYIFSIELFVSIWLRWIQMFTKLWNSFWFR